jgi:predicted butyrate kinase (DUF1464 family)
MPRVIGIDPGTISIDLCGLDDGRVFVERSLPAADALADPRVLVTWLQAHAPVDLIVGPSGYGLPLAHVGELSDTDLKLAFLAAPGESGGVGGLRSLVRALAASGLPVMLTPGVIHLQSVPAHRKVNRIDMGTADKVCAAALGIQEYAARRRCAAGEATFVLLELGGAFTAVIAVRRGQIVDGIAGSAGPLGARAAGALDAEVAFLAGTVTKRLVFEGGAATIAGEPDGDLARLFASRTASASIAFTAYVESAVKAVASAAVSLDADGDTLPFDVLLSGRLAAVPAIRERLARRLTPFARGGAVHALEGFTSGAKHAAQGAAVLADGLAGGASASIVEALGIREGRGTLLDYLHVISVDVARARLGIT